MAATNLAAASSAAAAASSSTVYHQAPAAMIFPNSGIVAASGSAITSPPSSSSFASTFPGSAAASATVPDYLVAEVRPSAATGTGTVTTSAATTGATAAAVPSSASSALQVFSSGTELGGASATAAGPTSSTSGGPSGSFYSSEPAVAVLAGQTISGGGGGFSAPPPPPPPPVGTSQNKPVSMKLFATWEVDRTPPNCIPRLCTMTITRLVLTRPFGSDLSAVIIAVKMQSSKRMLRSNEIFLPANGLLDTELDLTFSLQYPHFLKREGNQLHVILQRRKKYKNRTILGFKTLAVGVINMSQVLQKQMDLELELLAGGDAEKKDANKSSSAGGAGVTASSGVGASTLIGRVYVLSLSSQPVDHEDTPADGQNVSSMGVGANSVVVGGNGSGSGVVGHGRKGHQGVEASGSSGGRRVVEMFSDEDEDYSSPEEGSDSEPMIEDMPPPIHHRHHHHHHHHQVAALGGVRGSGGGAPGGGGVGASAVAGVAAAGGRRVHGRKGSGRPGSKGGGGSGSGGAAAPGAGAASSSSSAAAARQRNIKQKFVALLKKFKVMDPEDLDEEQVDTLDEKLAEGEVDAAEIEQLFDQLESLSDSGAEQMDGVDADSLSVGSTPKPSLKPFFNSSRNLQHDDDNNYGCSFKAQSHGGSDRQSDDSSKEGVSDSHPETLTDPEFSDPPIVTSSPPQSGDEVKLREKGMGLRQSRLFPKERPSVTKQSKVGGGPGSGAGGGSSGSAIKDQLRCGSDYRALSQIHAPDGSAPRKVLVEQLSRVLPSDSDNSLPDQITLVNTCERQAAHVASKLEERGKLRVVCTAGPADVRAALTCLVAKIQRFCNTKTQSPPLVKVVLIGGDVFINSLLRPYVELFSSKPPDWQSYVRFFIIPLHGGANTVAKHIGNQDPTYSSLFLHDSWKELLEKAEPTPADVDELVSRVDKYSSLSGPTCNLTDLPVAEAMVTYKEKSSDEESSQVFIPFISEVRVRSCPQSLDIGGGCGGDDGSGGIAVMSPPAVQSSILMVAPNAIPSSVLDRPKDRLTPPSSPHVSSGGSGSPFAISSGGAASRERGELTEPMDLQLDYWMVATNTMVTNSLAARDQNDANFGPHGESGAKSSADSSSKKGVPVSSGGGSLGVGSGGILSGGGSSTGTVGGSLDSGAKASIKTSIWKMRVYRLGASCPAGDQPTFSMQYWLKEKKPKTVMRLGKRKEKDKDSSDAKTQNVDGITRLICLSRGHNPLGVDIDGLEWSGVKFFQLSSQWQTHIKNFPVATFKTGAKMAL